MDNNLVILKNQVLPDSQNFVKLRKEGIQHIERLAKNIWTDYNTHDPGITTLEILCYAITDLGYRANFNIKDILAPAPGEANGYNTQFFTAAQILPGEPVTLLDYRKIIIDTEGVKNAWIDITEDYSPEIYLEKSINKFHLVDETQPLPDGDWQRINVRGFYTVRLELEDDIVELIENTVREIAKISVPASLMKKAALEKHYAEPVVKRLQEHRNLCEDFTEIQTVSYQNVTVCADIEVTDEADIEAVEAEICYRIQQYFAPDVNFYSLSEMQAKGIATEDIFEGPLLTNGFIIESELEQAGIRNEIRLSDIINLIIGEKDGISGVIAVKTMMINAEGLGMLDMNKDEIQFWILTIPDQQKVPKLIVQNPNIPDTGENFSKFTFYRDFFPYMANRKNFWNKLREFQQRNRKYKLRFQTNDLPIPEGTYRELSSFYPIQNDFPALYGTGLDGFPAEAMPNPDAKNPTAYLERQGQIKQLKSYLLFFEQIMANYLATLANIKNVFSWDENLTQSTFTQLLNKEDFFESNTHSLKDLFTDYAAYESTLADITESPTDASKRRSLALDHLLARFAENLTDYALLTKAMFDEKAEVRLIKDKVSLLKDYPIVSGQRGMAFNYKPLMLDKTTKEMVVDTSNLWDSSNVSGLKKRIARLLGFQHYEDTNIAPEFLVIDFQALPTSNYAVLLNLPSTSPDWTMRSVHQHASEEYAEGELLYWLSHGSQSQYFEVKNEYDAVSQKGKFFFILKKIFSDEDCLEPKKTKYSDDTFCNRIAKSQSFNFAGTEKSQAAKDAEAKCRKVMHQVIAYLKKYANAENFLMAEHLLLRPRAGFKTDEYHFMPVDFCETSTIIETICDHNLDLYTFRISIVLPAWCDRFHNIRFRQLVEKTIRMETPAHIYPRICWVNVQQMRELEGVYKQWIAAMANSETSPGDDALGLPKTNITVINRLIDKLFSLNNIYPSAILHDCDDIESDNPQVVLDYTTLGIL